MSSQHTASHERASDESAPDGARTTTDHGVVRRWAEARGGRPATVAGTGERGEEVGVLRIHFPDAGSDDQLQDVGWDAFFDKFEGSRLAFVYQEHTSDGAMSRFGIFVSRDQQV